jgi:hypothetical protein
MKAASPPLPRASTLAGASPCGVAPSTGGALESAVPPASPGGFVDPSCCGDPESSEPKPVEELPLLHPTANERERRKDRRSAVVQRFSMRSAM